METIPKTGQLNKNEKPNLRYSKIIDSNIEVTETINKLKDGYGLTITRLIDILFSYYNNTGITTETNSYSVWKITSNYIFSYYWTNIDWANKVVVKNGVLTLEYSTWSEIHIDIIPYDNNWNIPTLETFIEKQHLLYKKLGKKKEIESQTISFIKESKENIQVDRLFDWRVLVAYTALSWGYFTYREIRYQNSHPDWTTKMEVINFTRWDSYSLTKKGLRENIIKVMENHWVLFDPYELRFNNVPINLSYNWARKILNDYNYDAYTWKVNNCMIIYGDISCTMVHEYGWSYMIIMYMYLFLD